ncbi:MAG TPA: hypothetical protein VFV52_07285 [Bacilli bacterium]|nr:hypothetical protein [Bacilli bacterium]
MLKLKTKPAAWLAMTPAQKFDAAMDSLIERLETEWAQMRGEASIVL